MSREMKDSGIEYIGKIPKDWRVFKNKYLFLENKSIVGDKFTDYQLLSLTTKGIKTKDIDNPNGKLPESFSTYQQVSKENLVLCLFDLDVSAVFSGVSDYEGMISPAYKVFTYKRKFNKDFVDFWFKNVGFDRSYMLYSKSLRHTINSDNFKEILSVYPCIAEQDKVANFLQKKVKRIEENIKNTKSTIEDYKLLKQSIITEAVTKGLDKNVQMKDSGIEWNRHIPVHWETVSPKRLFIERKERAKKTDEQLTASQKHGIISQTKFMEIENQKVVLVEKNHSILKHVEPNDFVISMRSFQGGLEHSTVRGCISSAYVMLIPNEKVHAPYFRWLFKSVKYINALQSTSNLVRDGQALRYANFIKVPLFIFSITEQMEIADYLDRTCLVIDGLIDEKMKLISELERYKKSFIYEYVTGKKEVE